MSDTKIVNVVATGFLGRPLDLYFVAQNMLNIIYNPQKFVAAIARLKEPKTTFLLFPSGKYVCTGATSIIQAKRASEKITEKIKKIFKDISPSVQFLDFEIQNVVGSYYTGFKISLEQFYYAHMSNSLYEPEFFPGLRYLLSKAEKKTVLIFISGKIVITGFRSEEQVFETAYYMHRLLLKCKRE